MIETVRINETYRNKKHGTIYIVWALATCSETMERLVVYRKKSDEYGFWVRPLDLFKEKFEEVGEDA